MLEDLLTNQTQFALWLQENCKDCFGDEEHNHITMHQEIFQAEAQITGNFFNSAECSRYFLLKSKCKGEVVGVAVNKCFSLITNCEYLSTSIDIIQSKKNIDCVKSRQIRMHKSIFCLIANSTTAYSITFWHTLLPS